VSQAAVSLSVNELKDFLRIIGLARNDGELYLNQRPKFLEILEMANHLTIVCKKIAKRKSVTLLDCGCGKGYLTFLLNHILTRKLGRSAFFIGVDRNPRLIRKCTEAQRLLGFENMEFQAANIMEVALKRQPDITYCLHACDVATDETIAKGVTSSSRFITVVPCCQREVGRRMRSHPLFGMTQFPVIKERLSSLVTDAIRALVLGAAGYKVEIFEFIPANVTPKNLMLRAERIWPEQKRLLEDYRRLKAVFHLEPKLEEYLPLLSPSNQPSRRMFQC
jgi:SAM-dependent methyltransferase